MTPMTPTLTAIVHGFKEAGDRLLSGKPMDRGESIALAITAAYVKQGVMLGMIDNVTVDYVARVEAALYLLDEPKTIKEHAWN